jgi:hypothetical protein
VRIAIEKDDPWPQWRVGLSIRVDIARGNGDPQWVPHAAVEMRDLEMRYKQVQQADRAPGPREHP